MTFDDTQKAMLQQKLEPKNVKKLNGNDYIEGWHAINEANRIFGYDGWSYRILELATTSTHTNRNDTMVVGYLCRIEVSVGDVVRQDVGFGTGMSKTDISSCHEGASKEAVTDALKRALRSFGNQFGLALYDKTKVNVGVNDAPKPQRRSKADSREDYKRIQKLIDDAPDMAALVSAWKDNYHSSIKTMHVEFEDKITVRKDDKRNQLEKKAA